MKIVCFCEEIIGASFLLSDGNMIDLDIYLTCCGDIQTMFPELCPITNMGEYLRRP